MLKRTVHFDSLSEAPQIFLARNRDRAELAGDGGRRLNIEEDETPAAQMFDQMVKCHFRSITDSMKHGFARKETADRDAIDAADKLAALPAFDAVGVTPFVQSRVG